MMRPEQGRELLRRGCSRTRLPGHCPVQQLDDCVQRRVLRVRRVVRLEPADTVGAIGLPDAFAQRPQQS